MSFEEIDIFNLFGTIGNYLEGNKKSINTSATTGHSVTLSGYQTLNLSMNDGNYIIIHDTWGSTPKGVYRAFDNDIARITRLRG